MLATKLIRTIAIILTLIAELAATSPGRIGTGDRSPDRNVSNTTETRLAGERRRPSRPREGLMAPQDFCEALQKNDRAALKAALDPELAKLDAKGDAERNFQTLKAWMEKQACVASVDIERGVLRTDPPIKQFTITVRTATPGSTEKREIGVRIAPKRYEFDLKK
jgi:hypothetical protein